LLGVFGQGERTTDAVLQIVGDLARGSAVDTLRAPIQQLVESSSAGFALIAGIVGALWSASGYIGAFGRAMNRIDESTKADRSGSVIRCSCMSVANHAVGQRDCSAGGVQSGHAGEEPMMKPSLIWATIRGPLRPPLS
jgi:hypothetical protein